MPKKTPSSTPITSLTQADISIEELRDFVADYEKNCKRSTECQVIR
jgi:hypothetical protein